jgi:hypothetical protein
MFGVPVEERVLPGDSLTPKAAALRASKELRFFVNLLLQSSIPKFQHPTQEFHVE